MPLVPSDAEAVSAAAGWLGLGCPDDARAGDLQVALARGTAEELAETILETTGEVERAETIDVAVPCGGKAEPEDEDERAGDGEEAAFARARSPFPPRGGTQRA